MSSVASVSSVKDMAGGCARDSDVTPESGAPDARASVDQELSSGRPGGLTWEVLTASLERFQAASQLAYWPCLIR